MPHSRASRLCFVIVALCVSMPAVAAPSVPDLFAELMARDEALVRQARLGFVLLAGLSVVAAVALVWAVALKRRLAAARQLRQDDLDALGSVARELAAGAERPELPAVLLRQTLLVVPEAERASLLENEAGGPGYRVIWSEGAGGASVTERVVPAGKVTAWLTRGGEDLGARVVLLPRGLLGDGVAGRALAVEIGSGPERRFLILEGLAEEAALTAVPSRLQALGELLAAGAACARQTAEITSARAKETATGFALERTRAELERVSRSDSLTGLPNRREVLERLTAEWRRICRYGGESALVLADLDHFRDLNDAHGPECGDFVLVETARLLRKVLRDQDTAARWGGEEFLVLLPETELDGGILAAERVRTAMESADFMWQGELLGVTLSLSVVALSTLRTPAETIGLADEALRRAKGRGRNRVEVAKGSAAHWSPAASSEGDPSQGFVDPESTESTGRP